MGSIEQNPDRNKDSVAAPGSNVRSGRTPEEINEAIARRDAAIEREARSIDSSEDARNRGYVSTREKRRKAARRGGLASGSARRARSHKRAWRSQRDGLALAYPVQRVSRATFVTLFAQLQQREGITLSARGLQTAYVAYRGHSARYRVKGQDHRTCRPQQARGMERRGRPRCPRTMQRVDRRLEAMGLIRVVHVKRLRATAGHMDHIAVRLLNCFVALPSAPTTGNSVACVVGSPPPADSDNCHSAERNSGRAPPDMESAPPDGGRIDTPAPPAGYQEGERGASGRLDAPGSERKPEGARSVGGCLIRVPKQLYRAAQAKREPMIHVNPFTALQNLDEHERQVYERGFLDFFGVCVATTNDVEEEWAYREMRNLYDDAIRAQDDNVPGFFAAMQWAAQELHRRGEVSPASWYDPT